MRLVRALALLLVSCSAFTASPTASPAPTEFVLPTRSPAPTRAPFTGHYGFLVANGAGYAVTREDNGVTVGTIDLVSIAVSPDGVLVAGFTKDRRELRVVAVASPSSYKSLALPVGETGLDVAWSVEQEGVLYSVAGNGWSALRTYRFASTPPAEIARIDGVRLRPALWDPLAGDLAAAFVVADGFATEYVLIRGTDAPERRTLPDKRWQDTPAVSGDGHWIILASTIEPTLRVFQSDIPSTVLESHGINAGSNVSAIGRPGSGALGVVFDRQLLIWDPSTNQRGAIATSEEVFGIVCFRFDGSAAVVKTVSGHALVTFDGKLTPLSGDVRFGVALP